MPPERQQPRYRIYRAAPPGLLSRLRGEPEELKLPSPGREPAGSDGLEGRFERFEEDRGGVVPGRRTRGPRLGRPRLRGPLTWQRGLRWLAGLIVAWVALSFVLFLISAQEQQGSLPSSVDAALSSGPNMLFGTDTVLILGTDQRPAGTHEAGANTRDAGSRSDTIMLWRIGGGTSRRLSIPRDTVAAIPGHGTSKINAAYAYGGPALTVRTVEAFTGLKINHVIVINLANFPRFIDAIGGIDVTTGRVCSVISGGVRNGGWTLNLGPGAHHLNGRDALVLARTRENRCNPAENDLTRVKRQQQILNAIKSRLLSVSTFFRLPWASWAAPQAVRTDMGGFTLLSLFAASELGGSAPTAVLKPTGGTRLADGESALTVTPGRVQAAVQRLVNG